MGNCFQPTEDLDDNFLDVSPVKRARSRRNSAGKIEYNARLAKEYEEKKKRKQSLTEMAQQEFEGVPSGAEVRPQSQPRRASSSTLAREAMAARNRMSKRKEGVTRGGQMPVSAAGAGEKEEEEEEDEEEEEVIRNSLGMVISRPKRKKKEKRTSPMEQVPLSTPVRPMTVVTSTAGAAAVPTSGIQLDFAKDHATSQRSESEEVLRNSLGMIIRRSPVKRNVEPVARTVLQEALRETQGRDGHKSTAAANLTKESRAVVTGVLKAATDSGRIKPTMLIKALISIAFGTGMKKEREKMSEDTVLLPPVANDEEAQVALFALEDLARSKGKQNNKIAAMMGEPQNFPECAHLLYCVGVGLKDRLASRENTTLISEEIAEAAVSLTSHLLQREEHAQALVEAGSEQALVTISRLARFGVTKDMASTILRRVGELTEDPDGAKVRHEFFSDALILELSQLGIELENAEEGGGGDETGNTEKKAEETHLLPSDEVENRLRTQSELLRKANEELRRRTSGLRGAEKGSAVAARNDQKKEDGAATEGDVTVEEMESERQEKQESEKEQDEQGERPKSSVAALKAKLEGKFAQAGKGPTSNAAKPATPPKPMHLQKARTASHVEPVSTPPPPQPSGAPNSKQSKVAALKAKLNLGDKIGRFGGGANRPGASSAAPSRKRPGSVSSLAAKLEGRFRFGEAPAGKGAAGGANGHHHHREKSYSAPPLPSSFQRPTNVNLVKKRRGEKIARLKAKMNLKG